MLKFCAARKPGNSRIGSREPGRKGVCWLAGCGEQDARRRELGEEARNRGLGSGIRSGEKVVGSSDIPTLCETGLGEKT